MAKKILFDCERMKYPNTGLYSYCSFLGEALIQNATPFEDIFFYANDLIPKKFNQPNQYIQQSLLDKLFFSKEKEFDIWHATHQEVRLLPKSVKTKLILTIHDINFMYDEKKGIEKKKIYLAKLKEKIKSAHHLIFISHYVANDVAKYIDISNKPKSVIYNGADLPMLTKSSEPAIKPASAFIFALGLITTKKNFHVLPALLVNNNYQLVIGGKIGDKQYQQKIIEESRKLGVIDRLIFTGAINEHDKQWYYKNCLAFAFPSLAEGFGLPALEAMHFGKPVFLSKHTSLPEIGSDFAYYFDQFDITSMHAVFEQGMEDYATQNKFFAIQQHAANFTWKNAAKQYLEVYRSLY